MKGLIFLKHALERMEKRGLTEELIIDILYVFSR